MIGFQEHIDLYCCDSVLAVVLLNKIAERLIEKMFQICDLYIFADLCESNTFTKLYLQINAQNVQT